MGARSTIEYQPALDGVRAIAVAVVLLFHAEVPGFDGGYLGVSVFFTLSGYLITSLLVHEHDRTGRIALGAFYSRRVRRLLPASTLCLAAIVLVSVTSDAFAGVADLPRQVAGSILQVANWVFLAGEGSYQQIFQQTGGARSPVEHFWSLAIEEQFYWVWPPTMLLVAARARTPRARVVAVGALTAVFAAAAPLTAAVWGADAAYWATPARIAEILMGALLAVVLAARTPPAWAAWLAPASLVALAACVTLFPPSSGPAYQGWLPVFALVSALLIAGLQQPGPVRTALSTPPFVWLGRVSYGVYLYHWPIYVVLDADRTGLDGAPLVLVQLAVTLALAQMSSVLVERPIRSTLRMPQRVTFASGGLATAAVVALALTVVPEPLGEYWLGDDAAVEAAAIDTADPAADVDLVPVASAPTAVTTTEPTPRPSLPPPLSSPPTTAPAAGGAPAPVATTVLVTVPRTVPSTAPPSTTEPPIPELPRPVRIVVAGDSTARATGTGLIEWAAAHPDLAQVEVVGVPGCGFLREGERREGGFKPIPEACDAWLDGELPDRVAALEPDVVMLMVTTWDLVDHVWDGAEYTPLDAEFERRMIADYTAIQTEILASGAGAVAWVKAPIPNVLWQDQGTGQEDPARHEVAWRVMDGLASTSPGTVRTVDLAAWLEREGLADDREARPDGVHLEPVAATDVAERYLGERLIRVAVGQ